MASVPQNKFLYNELSVKHSFITPRGIFNKLKIKLAFVTFGEVFNVFFITFTMMVFSNYNILDLKYS